MYMYVLGFNIYIYEIVSVWVGLWVSVMLFYKLMFSYNFI